MTRSARGKPSRGDQQNDNMKNACCGETIASLNPRASSWDATSQPSTGTVHWDNTATNDLGCHNVPTWDSLEQSQNDDPVDDIDNIRTPVLTHTAGSKTVSSPGTTSSSELEMNVPLHSWYVPAPQSSMWSTRKRTSLHGTSHFSRQFSKCELEEEREEEALPSYLSYLQPSPSLSPNIHSFQQADQSFHISVPNVPSVPNAPSVPIVPIVANVPHPSSQSIDPSQNLTEALRTFIASTIQHSVTVPPRPTSNVPDSSCCSHCTNLTQTVHFLQKNLHQMSQQLDHLQSSIPFLSQFSKKPSFIDRMSTLEGRQSSFQSQLAQLFQLFGFSMGKDLKKQPVKLHKSIQDAITELPTFQLINHHSETIHDSESILSALSREHEASLTRMSEFLEGKIAYEGTQRVSLESRIQTRLSELEEWLQQLEAESSSRHDPISALSIQLAQLQTQMTHMERQKKGKSDVPHSLKRLQTQLEGNSSQWNSKITFLEEEIALLETQTFDLRNDMKCQFETLFKRVDDNDTQALVRQCVSVIAHQVACITREYMNVCMEEYHTGIHEVLQKYVTKYKEEECVLPRRWRRHINS
uniref:Uncharacterized protein AlNc14C96G5870 n=1 Tax=Albugo laibachii Nc14 TaxID=890382 RepID=F0WGZ5_9STRA|nr:conserved hypothetical protein [Albugo laibachii Nc14]|eukprot:CCA20510.1 conserved hypothetical protein [Albugo laibachii Nc14]